MRNTKHNSDSRKYFDWMEIAARDLYAARLLFEKEQCLEIAAFHCQQGIEKAFKAYIIFKTGTLVDGHNLTWLCRQAVKQNSEFKKWLEATAGMNRLYIETRYPSDIDMHIEIDVLEKIIETTSEIYDFISNEVYALEK